MSNNILYQWFLNLLHIRIHGQPLKKKNPNSQAIPHMNPIITSKGRTQALVFFKIPGVIPGCSQIVCK